MSERFAEAGRITEELMTPTEKLTIDLAKLQALFLEGAINAETYRRAVAKTTGDAVAETFRKQLEAGDLSAIARSEGVSAGKSLIEGLIMGTANVAQTLRQMLARIVSEFLSKKVEIALGMRSAENAAAGGGGGGGGGGGAGPTSSWGTSLRGFPAVDRAFHSALSATQSALGAFGFGAFGFPAPSLPGHVLNGLPGAVSVASQPALQPSYTNHNHRWEIRAFDTSDWETALERSRGILQNLHLKGLQEDSGFRNATKIATY